MSALGYLFATTWKNRIKQLRKNPGQLVLVILFVAMLAIVLVTSVMGESEQTTVRPQQELQAIIMLLYAVMFILVCMSGLSSGASFYAMADVNLIFCAPLSQKKVLFYGLVRQLGTSALLGFFLLYQYTWLHNLYDLSFGGLLIILLGYCLTVFCGQFTSMVIYSFTSNNDARRRIVRVALYALCAAALAVVGLAALQPSLSPSLPNAAAYPDIRLAAAVQAANSWVVALFPVAGWLKAVVAGLFSGSLLPVLIGGGAAAAYIVGLVVVVTRMRSDFYEDVLKATEVSFTAITASKQGKMTEAVPANVKVGKTGINNGRGPGVFFYKHQLENRRSRLLLFDRMTMIMMIMSIGFAYFMRGEGLVAVFAFATYMQVFSTSMGRWLRELLLPYVYMMPCSPFRKLIGICKETIYKAAAEAVVVMAAIGLVMSASPLEIAILALARFAFALLFIAGNIAVERIFGQIVNKVLIILLFFLTMMVLMLPGVIVGSIVGSFAGLVVGMLIVTAWNVGVATLIVFLCRNILNYAELNNR